jgi:hypothetical protein
MKDQLNMVTEAEKATEVSLIARSDRYIFQGSLAVRVARVDFAQSVADSLLFLLRGLAG